MIGADQSPLDQLSGASQVLGLAARRSRFRSEITAAPEQRNGRVGPRRGSGLFRSVDFFPFKLANGFALDIPWR
jgi:hypothetical protein